MYLFLAFDLCRFCVDIQFFHSRHNGQWPPTSKDFYTRSYPLHYFLILILEKESVFPFSMLSANKGTTGTIVIMLLVWRGPWLIEPVTSNTRSQHSTTRLSRRRLGMYWFSTLIYETFIRIIDLNYACYIRRVDLNYACYIRRVDLNYACYIRRVDLKYACYIRRVDLNYVCYKRHFLTY